MPQRSTSISSKTWKRLKKNKGALLGLGIIAVATFIAIFGYLLAPDGSPNADFQTLEIQAKGPGYTQLFLKFQDKKQPAVGWFNQLMHGQPANCRYLPINSYTIHEDELHVNRYVDEDSSVMQHYSINELTHHQPELLVSDYLVTNDYWLGTDKFGRDIASRLMIGTRVSLGVGMIAVFISLTLGIFLGAVAGYYRGRIDAIILWLINVTWSIPTLLLVFALTIAIGKGFWQIFIAVGLTMWVGVARIIRGQVMAVKELEYVLAARALGFSDSRIIIRHILPNVMGPVMVIGAGNFATAIIIEAGLSFLGIGVQPPQPSWGLMIKENYQFIITHQPLLAIIPGIAIMLLVLAFNLLGNGLRDAVDVRDAG